SDRSQNEFQPDQIKSAGLRPPEERLPALQSGVPSKAVSPLTDLFTPLRRLGLEKYSSSSSNMAEPRSNRSVSFFERAQFPVNTSFDPRTPGRSNLASLTSELWTISRIGRSAFAFGANRAIRTSAVQRSPRA